MIEETGKVIKVDGNIAIVSSKRSTMCKGCAAQHVCHSFGSGEDSVEIKTYNVAKAKVGDVVKVVLPEKNFLKASFIVYGIPILFLIIFSVFGKIMFKKDIFSFIFGFSGFLFSFLLVKYLDKKSRNKYLPEIVEIVSDENFGNEQKSIS